MQPYTNRTCPACDSAISIAQRLTGGQSFRCKHCGQQCERLASVPWIVAVFIMIWVLLGLEYRGVSTSWVLVLTAMLFGASLAKRFVTPITPREITTNRQRHIRFAVLIVLFLVTIFTVKLLRTHV